jgi:endonuclease/exonuclease/phosphatase family metal-dependent hydrolase
MAADQLSAIRLRVATYNVHDCVGRDGVYSPDRIAGVVADLEADVVGLQEVTLDHSGDVVGRIERLTAMQSVDGTLFERGVGRYGNLLLSRRPVVEQRLHDISWAGREPRGVLDAHIEVGGRLWRLLITHLGLNRHERRDQITRLAALVSDDEEPTVLLGDLNVWASKPTLMPLVEAGFAATTVRTFPTGFMPSLALDRIMVRTPARLDCAWRHVEPPARVASDHFPLVAEVRLSDNQA